MTDTPTLNGYAAGWHSPAPKGSDSGSDLPVHLGLLRLIRWPALPQLQTEQMADVARLCALLARRDTAAPLVPRLLGISRERAQALLSQLYAEGCLTVLGRPGGDNPSAAAGNVPAHDTTYAGEPELPPQTSFIAKLWKRLVTVN